MTNASPSTTAAATTAPSSENTGPSPPGPNCSASPPARLPKSFMSVSMQRRRAGLHSRRPPLKLVGRCKEIIARSTNAPFAPGANRHMARRRRGAPVEPAPCFRRGFPDCALASAGPWRQINDADIRSCASKIRTPSRRLSSFIGLYRPLPTRLAAALEGPA